MAFEHGSGSYLNLDDSTGTPCDISTFVTSVDGLPEEVATHDVTTLTKSSVVRLAGLKDVTFTVQGIFDATLDGYLGPAVGNTLTYMWGPQGSAGSDIKYSGEAILKSYKTTGPVANPVGWTAVLERTGDGARGTF